MYYENLFTHSEIIDARSHRVFKLGKEEFTVVKHISLSTENVQLFTHWRPVKLTRDTESTICNLVKDEQLMELTDTCRKGGERRFDIHGYCVDPAKHAWILQIHNAIVCENNFNPEIYWATFTESGVVIQSQLDKGIRPIVPLSTRIRYYSKLASPGYSVHVNSPGHFPVEILPRLVRMYNEVPPDVPLLWPSGPQPLLMLKVMIELKVLDGKRYILKETPESIMKVKQLYIYHGDDDFFPQLLVPEFTYMHDLIMRGMEERFGKPKQQSSRTIVVIDRRNGPRSVINHKEMVQMLKDNLEHHVVDYFIDNDKMANYVNEVARVFYEADIIISPHGASLGNIIFARPGTSIIEFSWDDATPALPTDFMCFSRNLKLQYSTVAGKGSKGSPLTMNSTEVLEAVKIHLGEVDLETTFT